MLDSSAALVLVQFSLGATLASIGLSIIFYQYLASEGGKREDESTKLFGRIFAVTFLVFGTYVSITAFFR